MDKYSFYFDEAFHDRKITLNGNDINIHSNNSSDIYIGVFWGCKLTNLDFLQKKMIIFDNNQRQRYGLKEGCEFKGTTIKQKNFQYGIKSFNHNCLGMYAEFFDLLLDNKIILHLSFQSKIDLLIMEVFKNLQLPKQFPIIKPLLLYSIIKFLAIYWNTDIFTKFFNEDESKSQDILNLVINSIETVLTKIKDVKRKQDEYIKLQQILMILKLSTLNTELSEKYNWDYQPVFDGFNNLLCETKISRLQVDLTIDQDEKTYKTALKNSYATLKEAESDKIVGIRIADILSNFIGRIVYSISQDLKEDTIASQIDYEKFDYETKKMLSSEWFNISLKQYLLYVKIYQVIFEVNNYYYKTYSSNYFDYVIVFFSLIQYIGSGFESYENFQEVILEQHVENFNEYVCNNLNEKYREIDNYYNLIFY